MQTCTFKSAQCCNAVHLSLFVLSLIYSVMFNVQRVMLFLTLDYGDQIDTT